MKVQHTSSLRPAFLSTPRAAGFALAALLLAPAPGAASQDPGHYAETASRHELNGQRLRRYIAWLAHDEREGRRAGTQGELDTALWIAAMLRRHQWTPAGEDEYLQPFEVPLPVRDTGGSYLRPREAGGGAAWEALAGPEHLVPLSCSAAGTASGSLFFRGFGIDDGERGWSDYRAPLEEGAVVLLIDGEPVAPAPPVDEVEEADDGEAKERTVEPSAGFGVHATTFHKVMTAARHGAAAVLLAPHPDALEGPLTAFRPGLRAGIPALAIDGELAQALWPGYAELARRCTQAEVAPTDSTAGVELSSAIEERSALAYNVLARVEGGDGPTVVIGAHLDHLGRGGAGSLAPDQEGEIHNGADDNASGVAVVLDLAYRFLVEQPPQGDVVLAFWSGEELGLLGSSYWAENPTVPLEDVAAYINLDMVGRVGDEPGDVLQVLGAGSSPVFAGWMEEAGEQAQLTLEVDLSAAGVGGSDHQTFLRRGIPALHLFSGLHSDYHRPSDDTSEIAFQGVSRVADLTLDLARRVQAAPELPFSELQVAGERSSSGWSVSFGTVPDYTFEGPGLLLSGTSPGSPAEEAGLVEGDVILQVGDVEIEDIHSFVYMLQLYKPGDVVLTRFTRDGVERSVRVTLRTRE